MLRTRYRWQLSDEAWLAQRVYRAPDFLVGHMKSQRFGAQELGGDRRASPGAWVFVAVSGELFVKTDAGEHVVRQGEALRARAPGTALLGSTPDVELLAILDRKAEGGPPELRPVPLATLGDDPLGWLSRSDGGWLHDPGHAPNWLDPERLRQVQGHVPSPATRRMAQLVSEHIAALERYPGVDDLAAELGLSERRTSEALGAYFRRYHASYGGWRSYLSTTRIELALSTLRQRAMAPARLAERLGYRKVTSLYHALERRGFAARAL
ncbi:MAG: hypothetical protein AAF447_13320 [Myxococcota bacterium]